VVTGEKVHPPRSRQSRWITFRRSPALPFVLSIPLQAGVGQRFERLDNKYHATLLVNDVFNDKGRNRSRPNALPLRFQLAAGFPELGKDAKASIDLFDRLQNHLAQTACSCVSDQLF
jgi:hypothetical protein